MPRDVLGDFEHHVLLAALRVGRDAYSVTILRELERCAQRDVAPAAVYIALRRLEDKGMVRSELLKDGAGGRVRRCVEVTAEGLAIVRDSRRRLLRFWDGLEPMLGVS